MFQGELARERRVKVFIATSVLLQQGWVEWSRMNQEIVIPNLTVMFNLKSDFVQNRLLSITDLITTNGYSLEGIDEKIESAIKQSKLLPGLPHSPLAKESQPTHLAPHAGSQVIIICPKCSQQLRVPSSGARVCCPTCHSEFTTHAALEKMHVEDTC